MNNKSNYCARIRTRTLASALTLLALFTTGCASTPSAYREIEMTDAVTAPTAQAIESGKIAFSIESQWPFSLFDDKEADEPALLPHDMSIKGRRTSSQQPKKVETDSTLIKVLDAIVRDSSWTYDWKGTLSTDGKSIPLVMTMKVSDSFNKIYRLKDAYTRTHENKKGITEKLKKFVGVDVVTKLNVTEPVDDCAKQAPFEIAHLTAEDGTEYHILATRTFAPGLENAPKQTMRSLIFARGQRYQITDSTNAVVYADCTVDSFTIYQSAVDSEHDRKDALKEGIGLFTAWLWSMDEHEQFTSMLN
ncbi:MAG: hypothetical protein K6G80_08170 [Treponema sp.]|nr:hypothetical protein [Treponema sp.]